MDFGEARRRAWRIVQLDEQAVRAVAEDENALLPGLAIVAIGGVLAGLGGAIVSMGMGAPMILFNIVLFPLGAAVGAAVLHVLGLLFGGRGRFAPLFNALNHGPGLVNWVGVVPYIGSLVSLVWGVVVAVVVLRVVHELSTGRAVAAVLIPLLLVVTCCAVATVMFGIAFFGMLFAGQH